MARAWKRHDYTQMCYDECVNASTDTFHPPTLPWRSHHRSTVKAFQQLSKQTDTHLDGYVSRDMLIDRI